MSLVFITEHDENIFNIVEQETAKDWKPDISVSKGSKARKYARSAKPDTERIEPNTFVLTATSKHLHKTMGYAETPLHAPDDFLRKNEGVRFRRKTDHKCIHKELPPIPEFNPCAKPTEREERNFKIKNIKAVACKPPRRPTPKYAFTRTGDVQILCKSGIMPAYIFHPNYGKVPKYLIATKRSQVDLEKTIQEHEGSDVVQRITYEERQKLLNGLKANWLELQKKYSILPVYTDTTYKKKRKADLEKELRQLEKDILLVENNPLIYVCPDDDSIEITEVGYKKPKQPFTKDISVDACLHR